MLSLKFLVCGQGVLGESLMIGLRKSFPSVEIVVWHKTEVIEFTSLGEDERAEKLNQFSYIFNCSIDKSTNYGKPLSPQTIISNSLLPFLLWCFKPQQCILVHFSSDVVHFSGTYKNDYAVEKTLADSTLLGRDSCWIFNGAFLGYKENDSGILNFLYNKDNPTKIGYINVFSDAIHVRQLVELVIKNMRNHAGFTGFRYLVYSLDTRLSRYEFFRMILEKIPELSRELILLQASSIDPYTQQVIDHGFFEQNRFGSRSDEKIICSEDEMFDLCTRDYYCNFS